MWLLTLWKYSNCPPGKKDGEPEERKDEERKRINGEIFADKHCLRVIGVFLFSNISLVILVLVTAAALWFSLLILKENIWLRAVGWFVVHLDFANSFYFFVVFLCCGINFYLKRCDHFGMWVFDCLEFILNKTKYSNFNN